MKTRNPFEVLGVSPEAEREVVRAAFRALARKYHPDMQRGELSTYATQRMAELNWAWEELQRDLSGWRARTCSEAATPNTQAQSPSRGDRDEDAWWRDFTKAYKRDKRDPLGWRAWIGSDVKCRNCGCVLNCWVYKCPDCMQTGTWARSRLHTIGHKFRIVYWVVLVGAAYAIALPFLLGLLAIPPILVFDVLGLLEGNRGWPWEWHWYVLTVLLVGMAVELGTWVAWRNWQRLRKIVIDYWEE